MVSLKVSRSETALHIAERQKQRAVCLPARTSLPQIYILIYILLYIYIYILLLRAIRPFSQGFPQRKVAFGGQGRRESHGTMLSCHQRRQDSGRENRDISPVLHTSPENINDLTYTRAKAPRETVDHMSSFAQSIKIILLVAFGPGRNLLGIWRLTSMWSDLTPIKLYLESTNMPLLSTHRPHGVNLPVRRASLPSSPPPPLRTAAGVPKYNAVREAYELAPATSFSNITDNEDVVKLLASAYGGDLDLLDAHTGALAERSDSGVEGVFGELLHVSVLRAPRVRVSRRSGAM